MIHPIGMGSSDVFATQSRMADVVLSDSHHHFFPFLTRSATAIIDRVNKQFHETLQNLFLKKLEQQPDLETLSDAQIHNLLGKLHTSDVQLKDPLSQYNIFWFDPSNIEAFLHQDGSKLNLVPRRFLTEDHMQIAIKNCPTALRHVPVPLRTKQLCILATNEHPLVIQYVPQNLITKRMLKQALACTPLAIEFFPSDKITDEMVQNALSFSPIGLRAIPKECRTLQRCVDAVTRHGAALEFVPDELKTRDLCKLAVENDFLAARFVPDHLKDKDIEETVDDAEYDQMSYYESLLENLH
jgi:hypothetical protein